MKKLEWERLLTKERQRKSGTAEKKYYDRNDFEADYDRIVGCSSVRRLQDKAQVFPLQENDFTRTRLTHSLEVSALARSIGKNIGKRLEHTGEFQPSMTEELSALLQTVGLIHDLGNPPFGHYGESVIRNWFDDWFKNSKMTISLSDQQRKDFLYFDGNVQNIRIVTKLQMLNDQYGANFTYATLATLIKYPWNSLNAEPPKYKYGYFQSESDIIKEIFEATGLEDGIRHPATFLLEATDDIIYCCDDIEDGVKKGCINWEIEYLNIKKIFKGKKYQRIYNKIEEDQKRQIVDMELSDKRAANVHNFRNYMQGYLFNCAIDEFIKQYEDIMNGEYKNELLDTEKELCQYLKNITRRSCYNDKEVLRLELVGDTVLKSLLDIYVNALLYANDINDIKNYEGKLYSLISSNFKLINKFGYKSGNLINFENLSMHNKLHLIVDYISGMTDTYAVNLYKQFAGISLP